MFPMFRFYVIMLIVFKDYIIFRGEDILRRFSILVVCLLCLSLILSGCSGGGAQSESSLSTSFQSGSAKIENSQSGSSESSVNSESSGVFLGELNGNAYTNESLGIYMEIPDGWFPLDDDQRMAIIEAGAEIVAGNDSSKQKAVDLSAANTLLLVSAYAMNPLEATDMNPSVQLIAEKLSSLASVFVRTPDDYLTLTKNQLAEVKDIEGVEVKYTFGEATNVSINGNEFRYLPAQLELADGTPLLRQDYYVYLDKSYAYGCISTYVTEEQKAAIDASIFTLEIK